MYVLFIHLHLNIFLLYRRNQNDNIERKISSIYTACTKYFREYNEIEGMQRGYKILISSLDTIPRSLSTEHTDCTYLFK